MKAGARFLIKAEYYEYSAARKRWFPPDKVFIVKEFFCSTITDIHNYQIQIENVIFLED
jgi:hypothetical protein